MHVTIETCSHTEHLFEQNLSKTFLCHDYAMKKKIYPQFARKQLTIPANKTTKIGYKQKF
ncbi:hypothetical protein CSA56_05445 [candidate division KSB3 bacterium]|uniref:Uncharacterized protein n=1 Tax=candidate division KSB3 bacterium TaxID=2044937 RepID=A0A2G6KHL0_9BACT|nr:MAG: hypothetical protein CSA56_05445 [candidate division KSB3 bacterium]